MEERDLEKLIWRLDALDEWRKNIEGRTAILERQVAEIVKADEIAEAVADKMSQSQTLHLSVVQRRWAWVFGALGALGSLSGIAALILHGAGH